MKNKGFKRVPTVKKLEKRNKVYKEGRSSGWLDFYEARNYRKVFQDHWYEYDNGDPKELNFDH